MLFHVATAADWREARASGTYTTSTRGRTLAQEGFIHCSRADQWPAVRERWYADVTEPLVLLAIDPERVGSPVVEEPAAGGGSTDATAETFPHLYGPLPAAAVVRVTPLERAVADLDRSFTSIFVGEMVRRIVPVLVVMLLAVVCGVVGTAVDGGDPERGGAVGLLGGLVVAAVAVWLVVRTRRRRGALPGRRAG